MSRRVLTIITLLLGFQVLATPVYSLSSSQTDKRLRKGGFGIRVAIAGPTEFNWHQTPANQIFFRNGIKIEPPSKFSANFGLGFGVFFETNLATGINLVIAADLTNIDAAVLSDQELFLDVSIGPKWALKMANDQTIFRPGFAVGIGYLGPMGTLQQPDERQINNYPDHLINRTTYTTLHASGELFFASSNSFTYMLEAVLFGTVGGGNSEVDVSTIPTINLRLGLMY